MHVNPQIFTLLSGLNNPSLPGIELSLGRMEALLAALGNPQKKLPPVIHIAGTNGKGSTLAMLRAMYEAAGYRVHAYTSPHLVAFNERIVLAGAEINDEDLLQYLQRVHAAAQKHPVTFFEATTAVALLVFAERPANLLLLEVGLGGRLDATNLAENKVMTVITPIAIDHSEFLGNSVDKIAAEKAGILRKGVPCVTAPQSPEVMDVLIKIAGEVGATLFQAQPGASRALGLSGPHQQMNAAVAVEVATLLAERFPLTKAQLSQGLAHATWPARLQVLTRGPLVEWWGDRGKVVLDGGHNAHAAAAMAAWLREGNQPAVMMCGMMKRKDAAAFFEPLRGHVERFGCIAVPGAPDSYAAEELAALAGPTGFAATDADVAIAQLAAVGKATLLIAGSLYLAGEILKNHG